MVLLAKFLLLLFMIIVVHGDIVVDVMQNVQIDGCCNGCCPCNSCEYKCKDDVDGKCRKECHPGEISNPVGCETTNGKNCDLKCCVKPEGCWNPITKNWVKNGTIADFGGCTCEICIIDSWQPDPIQILERCVKCMVFGEPHFLAFTGAEFEWHVPCYHALAQEGNTHQPVFGVFMEFITVLSPFGGDFSVVGETTYKEDNIGVKLYPWSLGFVDVVDIWNTRPSIKLLNQKYTEVAKGIWARMIKITGYYHAEWDCIRLYGTKKILIELCPWQITIWAPRNTVLPGWPSGYPTLGGLCSSNDPKMNKILVARDEKESVSPGINKLCDKNFGYNWQTEKAWQTDQFTCPEKDNGRKKRATQDPQTVCSNVTMNPYHDECFEIVQNSTYSGPNFDMFLNSCMFDLCIVDRFAHNGNLTKQQMVEGIRKITAEAKNQEDNTIDCCQDEACKAVYGVCFPIIDVKDQVGCDHTLCSGEDCTCCPLP